MGLTDAMTHLSEEIGALRQERGTFMKNLANETKEMKARVSEMRADFATARFRSAMKMKNDLTTFVFKLREGVAGFRNDFRADLDGASRAWFGPARGFAERASAEFSFKPERKRGRQRNA
jgi:hypothetical protein